MLSSDTESLSSPMRVGDLVYLNLEEDDVQDVYLFGPFIVYQKMGENTYRLYDFESHEFIWAENYEIVPYSLDTSKVKVKLAF